MTISPFYCAVYGRKHSYAGSIYPTVCTHADSYRSCGGMCCRLFIKHCLHLKLQLIILRKVAATKKCLALFFRKMVHTHRWTHPEIIPHIHTNKPSSAEVTFVQQLKQSCLHNAMDAKDLFTVLHRFCKCLSETIFGIISE